jgi:chemotaxis protein MotB
MPIKKLGKADSDADKPSLPHPEQATHASGGHDESNWLISYADMMTLLCGFFIMLFSMAKLDEAKYDSFKEALVKQFGGEYTSATKEMAKFASEIIQELGVEQKAIVKSDINGVSIVFESTIFFETLSSDVTTQGKQILNKLIQSIKKRQDPAGKQFKIVVEGHTDGRPITGGIYPSNWELSGARAARVIRMFLDQGFASDHLTAIGYADTHPHAPTRNSAGQWDEKALAQNRRVVIRILEPKVDSIPFPEEQP